MKVLMKFKAITLLFLILLSCDHENNSSPDLVIVDAIPELRSITNHKEIRQIHDDLCIEFKSDMQVWMNGENSKEEVLDLSWSKFRESMKSSLRIDNEELDEILNTINLSRENYEYYGVSQAESYNEAQRQFQNNVVEIITEHEQEDTRSVLLEQLKNEHLETLNSSFMDATIYVGLSSIDFWKQNIHLIPNANGGTLADRGSASDLAWADIWGAGTGALFGGLAGACLGAVGGSLGNAISQAFL